MAESERDCFPPASLLQGMRRRSSKIFNLVPQIFICFLSFIISFFLDIATLQAAMANSEDIAGTGTVYLMIGRAQIGLAVCSSLYCWTVFSDALAGALEDGACLPEPKGNADFAIYNVTQCLHGANGKSANQQQLVMNDTGTDGA